MKLLPACFQARYDSFAWTETKSSRRTSARSKKSTKVASAVWPLTAPVPYDLAFAGFVWKPTSASPDNVQCFSCACQLDGWEETDVPAYEHLTHSPDCGFAINACVRIRSSTGDPERVEEDPLSEKMRKARHDTFKGYWPLDSEAGFPSVEQMADAGWVYDPTTETPDGVICPYCSLSLDSWDEGDDPLEEHRKRQDACLFFVLKELYHPESIPFTTTSQTQKEQQKAATTTKSKGKRASSRSSTARSSTIKKAPAKTTTKAQAKTTTTPQTKTTRGRKAATSDVEPESHHNKPLPALPAEESSPFESNLISALPAKPTSKKATAKAPTRGGTTRFPQKSEAPKTVPADTIAQEPVIAKPVAPKSRKVSKRTSNISTISATTRQTRGTKRTSESIDDHSDSENKRAKLDWPTFSTLPSSAHESTPVHLYQSTPPKKTKKEFTPIDIDEFFDMENIPNVSKLTTPEKSMTIEEFLLHEADRQEKALRGKMMMQIEALDKQYQRALAAVDEL